MLPLILSFTFIILASICNAVMDICAHKFTISIFRKLNKQYWDATVSWENKYIGGKQENGRVKMTLFGYTFNKHPAQTDAWHLFKSLMIVFLIASGSILFFVDINLPNWLLALGYFTVGGLIWNETFKLFYKRILISK
jgi:hypothetical protein